MRIALAAVLTFCATSAWADAPRLSDKQASYAYGPNRSSARWVLKGRDAKEAAQHLASMSHHGFADVKVQKRWLRGGWKVEAIAQHDWHMVDLQKRANDLLDGFGPPTERARVDLVAVRTHGKQLVYRMQGEEAGLVAEQVRQRARELDRPAQLVHHFDGSVSVKIGAPKAFPTVSMDGEVQKLLAAPKTPWRPW